MYIKNSAVLTGMGLTAYPHDGLMLVIQLDGDDVPLLLRVDHIDVLVQLHKSIAANSKYGAEYLEKARALTDEDDEPCP